MRTPHREEVGTRKEKKREGKTETSKKKRNKMIFESHSSLKLAFLIT